MGPMHPLFVRGGWHVEVSQGLGATTRRAREFRTSADATGARTIPTVPAVSVSWGRVLRGRWGLLAGTALPGLDVDEHGQRVPGAWVYSFATVQGEHASFGVGPGVGYTGATVTAGGEAWGLVDGLVLGLSAYTRLWHPWSRAGGGVVLDGVRAVRAPNLETGVRVRLGYVQVQYAWLHQFEGALVLPYPVEGALAFEDLHMLSLGLVFARRPGDSPSREPSIVEWTSAQ